jgi:hypothetical protein
MLKAHAPAAGHAQDSGKEKHVFEAVDPAPAGIVCGADDRQLFLDIADMMNRAIEDFTDFRQQEAPMLHVLLESLTSNWMGIRFTPKSPRIRFLIKPM